MKDLEIGELRQVETRETEFEKSAPSVRAILYFHFLNLKEISFLVWSDRLKYWAAFTSVLGGLSSFKVRLQNSAI